MSVKKALHKELVYVIHKHQATHLHYDLRLEHDGVLKSFAIPKEPPVEKGLKRLAVAVEDHELGYEKFEGVIPEGQYGAGKVEIWDSGTYVPIKYADSEITMDIKGEKLKGLYHLIKLKPTAKFKGKKNWLLFKG